MRMKEENESKKGAAVVPGDPLLEEAKSLINDFFIREFRDEEADFSDLAQVPLAYTEIEDDYLPVQCTVDLIDPSIRTYLGNVLVETIHYESLKELIDFELKFMDFDLLVYVSEEMMKTYMETVGADSISQALQLLRNGQDAGEVKEKDIVEKGE